MSRTRPGAPLRGLLVIGSLHVVAAALLAVGAFRLFGASSGADTNPPVCYNANGGIVSCSLTQPVVMLPTFTISLLILVVWQVLRMRRRWAEPARTNALQG